MGIMHQHEIEECLFRGIQEMKQTRKRWLVHDCFNALMGEFDNDWQKFCDFLQPLEEKGFIALEGVGGGTAIIFGEKGKEWRALLEAKIQPQHTMPNQTNFNINATNVNASAGDMSITINNTDAEHLVHILKEVLKSHPQKESQHAKLSEWLESGKSAVEILKGIASLVI